jgi:hypothetical protein
MHNFRCDFSLNTNNNIKHYSNIEVIIYIKVVLDCDSFISVQSTCSSRAILSSLKTHSCVLYRNYTRTMLLPMLINVPSLKQYFENVRAMFVVLKGREVTKLRPLTLSRPNFNLIFIFCW